jgi:hypothetical protein
MDAIDFREAGRQAYLAGEPSAPWLSAAVRDAVGALPVGGGAAGIMRAYSDGWHAANAAAPVVGVCTIDGVTPCPMHAGAVHVPNGATLAQCLEMSKAAARQPRVPTFTGCNDV